MNTKSILIIAIIVIVGLLIFQQYLIRNSTPKEDILLEKINKLELKLDSLNTKKDSIRRVVDSTHVKIVNNENYYKEVVNTIMLQPTSSDSSFITDYIRFHISQRDSTNIR
jgi:hypothetical protein